MQIPRSTDEQMRIRPIVRSWWVCHARPFARGPATCFRILARMHETVRRLQTFDALGRRITLLARRGRSGKSSLPTTLAAEPSTAEYRRLLEHLPVGAYTCDADGLIT